MNMNFYMPTHLFTGKDCVAAHKEEFAKHGRKCLIVTGHSSARKCGALVDVTGALEEQSIDYELFDEIGQNPQLTDCMRAAERAITEEADFIIGIGGGSPLDAAKCIAVLAANPGMDQAGLYSLNWENRPLPIIAVGTTAGTGSEVTKVSVITTPEGRKKSFHHEDVFPVAAFGDPGYTITLSSRFTRSTAIDALAHCMESYFSRNANTLSQSFAVSGIRILMDIFSDKAFTDGGELLTYECREALYNASIYGGLAINTTGTCLPHAMGYLLTEQFGLPHGLACAVFLEDFYRINKQVVPDLCERFLKEIGWDEKAYLETIRKLLKDVSIEITEHDILAAHERWIGNSSIAKGWGEITADMADDVLRHVAEKFRV